tara:strand:+ start:171 stop:686 length:516 start_codon:yes stop_codon:yes gene_type:complete
MNKSFQNKILFIGLSNDEKVNVETGLQKYNITYLNEFKSKFEFLKFDLICISDELYDPKLTLLGIPFFTIGQKLINEAKGLLVRPQYVVEWLKQISSVLPPVHKPTLKSFVVGTIVRSKTTPSFGKGIVTDISSETEVMVKFPLNKLLPKDQSIRCHRSQLQILGNINDYD